MRIVLDTNVIISALLFDGIPERVVLSVLGGKGTLVLSPFIVEETSRILQTKFKVQPSHVKLLEQILSKAEMQYFQPYLHVLGDEPDNRILETALQGEADHIVTGDRLLLELDTYKNIKIIKPAEFIKLVS